MKDKIYILLVDDEKDFLEPISFFLKSRGYSVGCAENGKKAIEFIKSEEPDIVFLDIHMPVMGGMETLAEIRKFKKTLPVIMVTAYGDEKIISQARQLGVSGFFPKKADLAQLSIIIETTLRTHKGLRTQPKQTKDK